MGTRGGRARRAFRGDASADRACRRASGRGDARSASSRMAWKAESGLKGDNADRSSWSGVEVSALARRRKSDYGALVLDDFIESIKRGLLIM